jgi:hypothetical protein
MLKAGDEAVVLPEVDVILTWYAPTLRDVSTCHVRELAASPVAGRVAIVRTATVPLISCTVAPKAAPVNCHETVWVLPSCHEEVAVGAVTTNVTGTSTMEKAGL